MELRSPLLEKLPPFKKPSLCIVVLRDSSLKERVLLLTGWGLKALSGRIFCDVMVS